MTESHRGAYKIDSVKSLVITLDRNSFVSICFNYINIIYESKNKKNIGKEKTLFYY